MMTMGWVSEFFIEHLLGVGNGATGKQHLTCCRILNEVDLGKTILSDRELYHDGQLQPILLSCSVAARAIKLVAGNLNLAQTL